MCIMIIVIVALLYRGTKFLYHDITIVYSGALFYLRTHWAMFHLTHMPSILGVELAEMSFIKRVSMRSACSNV